MNYSNNQKENKLNIAVVVILICFFVFIFVKNLNNKINKEDNITNPELDNINTETNIDSNYNLDFEDSINKTKSNNNTKTIPTETILPKKVSTITQSDISQTKEIDKYREEIKFSMKEKIDSAEELIKVKGVLLYGDKLFVGIFDSKLKTSSALREWKPNLSDKIDYLNGVLAAQKKSYEKIIEEKEKIQKLLEEGLGYYKLLFESLDNRKTKESLESTIKPMQIMEDFFKRKNEDIASLDKILDEVDNNVGKIIDELGVDFDYAR